MVIMQKISNFISLAEACKSATATRFAISNVPSAEAIDNMRLLCFAVYDPLCVFYGKKIPITSMFRSAVLNKKIGGAFNSQHMTGEAMDIDCDILNDKSITNNVVFHYILSNLKFDQLIWEFGTDKNPDWIHVSYSPGKNRNQVLIAKKKDKKTVYIPF
jgi:hypothetical protein